jgi:hypothetical protein
MIERVNKAFDFAVKFFLLGGGLSVLFYLLQSGKIIYIFLCIAIFIISFIVRNFIFHLKNDSGFSEAGIFLISILFVGYLIYFLNIDVEVRNYLPVHLLIESGFTFITIMIISLFSGDSSSKFRFANIIILINTLLFLYANKESINSLVQKFPVVSDLIIGTPIIYLGMVLLGISRKNNKSGKVS